jgi:hypothetical protein
MPLEEAKGDGTEMKVTLTASTGVRILVWREGESFCARQAKHALEPQICLGVDLFEVVAELTGLDLDDSEQANEAVALAARAQRRLSGREGEPYGGGAAPEAQPRSRQRSGPGS